jgi:hypothetical protein
LAPRNAHNLFRRSSFGSPFGEGPFHVTVL